MTLKLLYSTCKFFVTKNSPVILAVAGTACVAGAVVTAVRAGKRIEEIKAQNAENEKVVDDAYEQGVVSDDEYIPLVAGTKALAVKNYAKNCIVPAALGMAGIACFLWAIKILSVRNAALISVSNGLMAKLASARQKVTDEYGAEKAREIFDGVKVTEENGVVKINDTNDLTTDDIYVRYLDANNVNWLDDHVLFANWVEYVQNWANQRFTARGYLYLCEVCDKLDLPDFPEAHVVGWTKKKSTHVSFGLEDILQDFMYNGGDCLPLRFNCEGYILDDVPQTRELQKIEADKKVLRENGLHLGELGLTNKKKSFNGTWA